MLQSAIVASQTTPANVRSISADTSNRPAPSAQDNTIAEADVVTGFATELNSADLLQSQMPPPDADIVVALANEISIAVDAVAEQLVDVNSDIHQPTDTGILAEEWILQMLGQQSAQLQARDLAKTVSGDVQMQELPALATNSVEKTPELKQPLEQQALVPLSQSAAQKQAQAQPTFVINNTPDTNEGQVVRNVEANDTAEDKTLRFSPSPPSSSERIVERSVERTVEHTTGHRPEQTLDQTKSAIATLITGRLTGVTPTPGQESAAAPTSSLMNQTLTDAVPDRTLKLHGTEAKWGEQMLHTLRENVGLQLQHRQQSATIRLDPPELGAMEIFLSHESGRLTVQISASQSDVARMLQQTSDRLRQELVNQHFVQVNVQVSSDNQGGQRHSQQRSAQWSEEQITQNPQGTESAAQAKTTASNDILVTV
jgi:flagellar hook-length control protein FliK